MNNRRRSIALWSILALLIGVPLLVGLLYGVIQLFGERAVPLQIENQTDRVLTIYVQGVKDGEVEPNNNIEVKNLGATGYYSIEAKNSKGDVIYTKEFSFTEFNDTDWKVVIRSLEDASSVN